MDTSLKHQLQKNLLAVISLAIAIMALSYNSWRNEQSETNRNLRAAGFEIMRESAKLQLLIDTTTYSEMASDVETIKGWVSINFILSLSELMSPETQYQADKLKLIWTEYWSQLSHDKNANQAISDNNELLIKTVRKALASLN